MIEPPRSLCVLRLSAIGDVCHTLPVVRTLQDHWPETHITWIVGKLEHSLLTGIDGIEFLPYDKRGGYGEWRHLQQQLSNRPFDTLLHMQVALRASVLSLAVQADVRLGFDKARARDWQWLFTNRRIAPQEREHVMDGLFGFATALGATRGTPRWDIPVDTSDMEFARQIIPAGQRTLMISPCSSQRARNFRNWPVERFIAVAQYAEQQHGMRVLVSGGPSELEKEYAREITASVPGSINLVGQTSLKQLYALLGRASALISPDSGPAHMGNAAGIPVIGLYATSNPDRTGPYRREWTVNRYPDAVRKYLGKDVAEVRWGQRVRHPDAMELITIDDVCEKLDAIVRLTS